MPCFVNLPLRWMHTQPLWVDWFARGHIAPELGLDLEALQLPRAWHKDTASKFRDAGLATSVHLPFFGVDPCNLDDGAAAAARDQLKKGAELAALYGAEHMIGHPYYRNRKEGREADDVGGRWMEMSLKAWPDLPDIGGAHLFLENTYEKGPEAVAALVGRLNADRPGRGEGPAIGVCFDVGHWHCFAGCKSEEELAPWVDAFALFALHLHLHDNDGTFDQHRGLGDGNIPLTGLFRALAAREKKVTVTLEPHDVEALVRSVEWFEANPGEAGASGWLKPEMSALPLAEIADNIAT